MARALQFANQQLTHVRNQNKVLEGTVAVQNQANCRNETESLLL